MKNDTTALTNAAAAAVSAYRCAALGIPDKPLASAIDELETQLDVATDTAEMLEAQRVAARAHDFRSQATMDDFNTPPVRDTYERFLSLLVIAGMGDRFKAMDVRKAKGVEAAVEFLRECKLTNEAPKDDSLEIPVAVEQAKMIADLLALAEEPNQETVNSAANMLYGLLCQIDQALTVQRRQADSEHEQ